MGWGEHVFTTNICQTIHNNNPRSRDLSPGITTALYDVLCQPNAHHITQDILLHCGDICDVYENQYSQLGGILYSNITHLQYSKHTYNNQPFVYHIGWWCGIWLSTNSMRKCAYDSIWYQSYSNIHNNTLQTKMKWYAQLKYIPWMNDLLRVLLGDFCIEVAWGLTDGNSTR